MSQEDLLEACQAMIAPLREFLSERNQTSWIAHPPAKVSPFQTYNELQTAKRGVPDDISLSGGRDAIA